jgi:hypothetical protein
MKLQELLDSDVPYEVLKSTADSFWTKAKIGDKNIKFSASHDGDRWYIVFAELGKSKSYYGKTGSGNEFEDGSFVTSSMKEFLQSYNPQKITFSADKKDGENRARLYNKVASRLLKGYTRIQDDDHPPSEELFAYEKIR